MIRAVHTVPEQKPGLSKFGLVAQLMSGDPSTNLVVEDNAAILDQCAALGSRTLGVRHRLNADENLRADFVVQCADS